MVVENIKLRFIPETHELACHPIYLTVLIKSCTKAQKGSAKDSVIRQAHRELHDKIGAAVSEKAAQALVGLASELGLLEKKDLHWAARAHAINNISPKLEATYERIRQISLNLKKNKKPFRHAVLNLEPKERIIYLKYFLDADGAFFINLLKEVGPSFPLDQEKQEEFLKNGGIERVFLNMAEDYLANIFEIRPRFQLRQLVKRAKRGYGNHVRLHKFIPRMEILSDLGIVKKAVVDGTICYHSIVVEGQSMVKTFLEEFGVLPDLDGILSVEGDFYRRAARFYDFSLNPVELDRDYPLLLREIVKSYESVRDETFRLAHLDAIRDLVCINFLFDHAKICEWGTVNNAIEMLHKQSEKDIRYHVNDWGIISYLTMSSDYVKACMKA